MDLRGKSPAAADACAPPARNLRASVLPTSTLAPRHLWVVMSGTVGEYPRGFHKKLLRVTAEQHARTGCSASTQAGLCIDPPSGGDEIWWRGVREVSLEGFMGCTWGNDEFAAQAILPPQAVSYPRPGCTDACCEHLAGGGSRREWLGGCSTFVAGTGWDGWAPGREQQASLQGAPAAAEGCEAGAAPPAGVSLPHLSPPAGAAPARPGMRSHR